eukprot:TRINITY_DN2946_c0_g1_i1.p1 TRINITY_DN2946_c0_g1~~TRINITY_DN2946_c0_g1_i1.p1  ORF type:complete len:771 (+),score=171.84 TRINITY_DN2946_c0_g1_i1:2082-4394(+)
MFEIKRDGARRVGQIHLYPSEMLCPIVQETLAQGGKVCKCKMGAMGACLLVLAFAYLTTLCQGLLHDRAQHLGWLEVDLPHPPSTITLYLKHSDNVQKLDTLVRSVSYPDSPAYGKYFTLEEISTLISPSQAQVDTIMDWLQTNGVRADQIELLASKDVIKVRRVPHEIVSLLFGVPMATYQHPRTKMIVTRSPHHYTLPRHVEPLLDLVRGVADFPMVAHKQRSITKKTEPTTASSSFSANNEPLRHVTPAPTLIRVRGREQSLVVEFQPSCKDHPSTSTNPPCQDHPPVIMEVVITATPFNDVYAEAYRTVVPPQCTVSSGSPTVCVAEITVPNYIPLNVTVQEIFADSYMSSVAYFDYAAVSAPINIPQTLRSLYGVPQNSIVTNQSFSQSVVEFEQQYYSPSDLALFLQEMGLNTNVTVPVVGPNDETNPGGEANLDIQYIMGMAPGARTVFWSIAANTSAEIDDILAWAVAIGNTRNPPLVNSLSYGMTEGNVDTYLGKGYLARSDIEFQKLALMGITIIIASGDTGAGDLGGPPMGANTCQPLHADWPSQSPYVTSVGATMITPLDDPICYLRKEQGGIDCTSDPLGEIPTSLDSGIFWTSGGGFSNLSTTPDYQAPFVKQYLSTLRSKGLLPPSSLFNASGRAYPDVAAVGHNLWIALNGSFISVDGTSASAPIFAGIISLLNDARLNAGKAPLGFLNPVLYQTYRDHPDAFFDVVWGNNRCGAIDTVPTCCPIGYEAVPGFDAVAGVGTPNFPKLKEVIMRL